MINLKGVYVSTACLVSVALAMICGYSLILSSRPTKTVANFSPISTVQPTPGTKVPANGSVKSSESTSSKQTVLAANTATINTQPAKTIAPTKTAQLGQPVIVQSPTSKAVDTQPYVNTLQSLASDYAIVVSATPIKTSLSFATWTTAADNARLNKFATILNQEFRKYPKSFVAESKLKGIIIVENLSVQGQNRAAMPDAYVDNYLYFSIEPKYLNDTGYLKNVIHHEIGHMVENGFFGGFSWADLAWNACNASGFVYGAGGGAAYSNAGFANTLNAVPSFLTGYGTYGIEEDKAEIFADLVSNPTRINGLSAKDAGVKCKADLYRGYMSKHGLNL
jgi:hypothetical protein